ncbi:hypothetical protein HanRHA438_Chr07g0294321 [Helianthus annuus]|nr:hypothetical protein HanRHA438_Chr07g0294321 [Helianthus annuus]
MMKFLLLFMILCVVANNIFVDDHFQTLSRTCNEVGNLFFFQIVADNIFVDDHFQKLSKISDETGDVCNNSFITIEELFGVLPDLTMSSIGAAKNKSKSFDLEFGALVGCPDNSIKHEINKTRNFRRINQRVKALKNWKWDEVIEIDSFGED